jgi:predicted deacylase
MSRIIIVVLWLLGTSVAGQEPSIQVVETLPLEQAPAGEISRYWLHIIDNGLAQPVLIPVLIAKGATDGPVLGLTAAIHGNELNGIPVIQQLFQSIDPKEMKGTVVGIPGLNPVSLLQDRRRFVDEEDLNRNFPGKANGNRSQQFVHRIVEKVIRHFDVHMDLHTASFGRINSLYVRADLSNDTLAQLAFLQDADIVLQSTGKPSTADAIAATRTMRAEAMLRGIPSITIEYGDPQVFQPTMIRRGYFGVLNTMRWLGILEEEVLEPPKKAAVCKKSYWVYVDAGGLLEVPVALTQKVEKGTVIGILRNPFGDVIRTYYAPEKGIIIGKSTNPVNMNGGRIVHLGILAE